MDTENMSPCSISIRVWTGSGWEYCLSSTSYDDSLLWLFECGLYGHYFNIMTNGCSVTAIKEFALWTDPIASVPTPVDPTAPCTDTSLNLDSWSPFSWPPSEYDE